MPESRQAMYRGGPARTGSYPAPGGQGPSPAWKYRAGGQIASAPVVAGGTVYVTNQTYTPDSRNAATGTRARGMAHAVNALTGNARWSVCIEAGSRSSPIVTAGGDRDRVYFGSDNGLVHALDAHTGEQIWASRAYLRDSEIAIARGFPGLGVHITSSPAVDRGTVYIGGGDCGVYALDAARGTLRWTYQANQELIPGGPEHSRPLRPGMIVTPQVRSSPAVVDGTVFICGADLYLYALDAAGGAPRWSRRVGSEASPAVSDGTVYVGSRHGEVHALDAVTGEPRWQHQAAGLAFCDQPPAVADGVVYLAARSGRHGGAVAALDAATGERRWLHRCRTPVDTAPAVAAGLVHVSTGKYLIALSATTGARQWRHRPGWLAGPVSSPSVAGAMVFAGTAEGYLYALKAPAA